jgi:hypothetical protein
MTLGTQGSASTSRRSAAGDALIFGAIFLDDVVVVEVLELLPMPRFVMLAVSGALGLDHVRGAFSPILPLALMWPPLIS